MFSILRYYVPKISISYTILWLHSSNFVVHWECCDIFWKYSIESVVIFSKNIIIFQSISQYDYRWRLAIRVVAYGSAHVVHSTSTSVCIPKMNLLDILENIGHKVDKVNWIYIYSMRVSRSIVLTANESLYYVPLNLAMLLFLVAYRVNRRHEIVQWTLWFQNKQS